MTLRKSNWIAAACLAALSCTGAVHAQDDSAGVVRISDGRARTPVQTASFRSHQGYGYADSSYGGCPDCQNCNGPQCFHGMFQERYCKNSPDHGYSPPAKYPLHRRGVQYNQYFPNQYYGTPGASYQAAPVVYQPTDTTQLGYSYQHVPFWQPNASMMPQRPVPAQWHITAPAVYASNYHNGGGYGYGHGFGHGYGYGNNCDHCQQPMQSTPAAAPAIQSPTPAPEPKASIPPTPRQFENSAASGHIRSAAY